MIKTPVNLPTHGELDRSGELERSFPFESPDSKGMDFAFFPYLPFGLNFYTNSESMIFKGFVTLSCASTITSYILKGGISGTLCNISKNCDKMTLRLSYQAPQSDSNLAYLPVFPSQANSQRLSFCLPTLPPPSLFRLIFPLPIQKLF